MEWQRLEENSCVEAKSISRRNRAFSVAIPRPFSQESCVRLCPERLQGWGGRPFFFRKAPYKKYSMIWSIKVAVSSLKDIKHANSFMLIDDNSTFQNGLAFIGGF